MARYLSQQQIAEYRECFSLYDKKRNGKIRSSDLCTVMRSLGSNPTLTEVNTHLKSANKAPRDEMDFSEFLTIMHEQLSHENPSKEIFEAFELTDERGKGTIPASHLKHILMKTGEKLTEREVEQMFRAANIKINGHVQYDEFIRMVTLPLPDY
ncbi:calmodulin-like protein 4 [Styela clava]